MLAAGLGAVLAPSGSRAPPADVTATVDTAHPGATIPRSFLSFSFEFRTVRAYLGAAHVNEPFVAIAGLLGAAQHGKPHLRIGGDTTDESWWNPAGRPRPPGVSIDLGPAWVRALARAERRTRAPLALGLDLALGDPRNALVLVRAVRAALPPGLLRTVELGNEPDLWTRSHTFRIGRLVITRPRHRLRYGPADYRRDVRRWLRVLGGRVPPAAVGGFATPAWAGSLPALLAGERGRISEVTAHVYAIPTCARPIPAGEGIARLLGERSGEVLRGAVGPIAAVARRAGLPARVAEVNSAPCGGIPGASDAFASALWSAEMLFDLARMGVAEVDVHSWQGALYVPFVFRHAGTRTLVHARPLLYGLWLFAEATPYPSRLLPVRVDGGGVWATRGADGTLRVVAVNDDGAHTRTVRVRVPAATGVARVALLRAPSLRARHGVTFAGRTIGTDGRPDGARRTSAVAPRAGAYELRLPPGSAALLTVPGVT